eukprot:gene22852-29595_t
MKYNWEHPNWPHFEYETAGCQSLVYAYIKETSALRGAIDQLSDTSVLDTLIELMVIEALKTSEIEGEYLQAEDIRSSLRANLGLPVIQPRGTDERASGIARLLIDMRNTFIEPLTKEKLCEWHGMLMGGSSFKQEEIGCWRTNQEPMQIVSGPIGREKVYFEAPPSNRINREMDTFIGWFNSTQPKVNDLAPLNGPVRAAIVHLYFESIHPFVDGNGRIGRVLAEKVLSQDLGAPILFSLSNTIYQRRKEYYQMLHDQSGYGLTITEWVHFFVDIVYQAQRSSHDMIQFVLKKTKFWRCYEHNVNKRQEKALHRMLQEGPSGFEGGINAQKYMRIVACSKATATRDLTDLLEKGCLYRLPGAGPTTRYDINFT